MKLKYMLKKAINVKTGYLVAIVLVLMLVIGGYFSYALFTASTEAKGALNIVTGNLHSLIESKDLDKSKSISINPNETKTITLKLVNANGRKAKVNLYYESTSNKLEIGYLSQGAKAPSKSGYVLDENGAKGDSKTIYIRIKNNDSAANVITFGTDAGLDDKDLEFPSNKKNIDLIEGTTINENITAAFTYDQVNDATKCITGEEPTCQPTKCYENNDKDSCHAGTIIKYKVSNTEEYYFHVVKDDGKTMTLQSRNSLGNRDSWYQNDSTPGVSDNTKGPLTYIEKIEKRCEGWTNAKDLEYEMGVTEFNKNAFTGCDDNLSCTTNTYTMKNRTAKARMITVQEAVMVGCTTTAGSCPIWMYNYTYNATAAGGTEDDTYAPNSSYNTGTFTMNAYTGNSTQVWYVTNTGTLSKANTYSLNNSNGYGIKTVIEISKKVS